MQHGPKGTQGHALHPNMTQPGDKESDMLVDGEAGVSTTEVRRARPSWQSLPGRAKAFRLAHVAWGVVAMAALTDVWASAILRRRSRYLWASVAFLMVQGVALVIGRGDCPFGPFQRRLGDPVPMFELILPPRAAKAAIPVLMSITIAGLVAVVVRPARTEGVGAHVE